jgi:hypothetical protein
MKHSISINNKATSTYHSAGLHSLFSSFFSSFIKLISISIGQSIISCKKPKSILSILNLISQEALPDIPTSHPCSARLLLLLLLMDAKTMLNQFLQSERYGFQFFFLKKYFWKNWYIYIILVNPSIIWFFHFVLFLFLNKQNRKKC